MTKPPKDADAGNSETRSHAGRADLVQRRIEANYHSVQYAFVQFFTEHIADIVVTFDNDLNEMLVLAVLGQRRLEVEVTRTAEDHEGMARACMTASRISEVTNLPRQTVNRKLQSLRARGWIDRDPGAGWYVRGRGGAAPVRQDLNPLERRFAARLARLYLRLRRELD
jgi:DNA-binding MarR family transcriptional regulator